MDGKLKIIDELNLDRVLRYMEDPKTYEINELTTFIFGGKEGWMQEVRRGDKKRIAICYEFDIYEKDELFEMVEFSDFTVEEHKDFLIAFNEMFGWKIPTRDKLER